MPAIPPVPVGAIVIAGAIVAAGLVVTAHLIATVRPAAPELVMSPLP